MSRLAYAFDGGSTFARAAYALRKAAAAMRAAPFTHLVAALSIAAALLLCTVIGAATIGARELVEAWSRKGELTVYLAPGTGEKEVERLAALARELSGGTVRAVSADEALASLAASMGDAGQGLLDLHENPLSATLEIDLGDRPEEELRAVARELAALSSVEEVDAGEAFTERMARVAGVAGGIASALLPLLLLGAAVLVGSVVRLGVHERRKEIAILRLVGATDAFIRAPLWVEGALSG
ncbi:MAG TPA: permease-like cell division protein FtsX, partial [Vulgatibacter sp.]|nr:permease-like cell division protein FtsX [Vulgatibacter sp.]